MGRFDEQCQSCSCHYGNADPEAHRLMDEAGIECSLEQDCYNESKCKFYQSVEADEISLEDLEAAGEVFDRFREAHKLFDSVLVETGEKVTVYADKNGLLTI